MVGPESSPSGSSIEKFSIEQVDQVAFDLIGKFRFALRESPVFQRAISDRYWDETEDKDPRKNRYVNFQVKNRRYKVFYQSVLDDRMHDNDQCLTLLETVFSEDKPEEIVEMHNLILLSRKDMEKISNTSPIIQYFTKHDNESNIGNITAVNKARGMLRRLSSQK